MSYESPITDSDVIDGLNIGYLKFFRLWKVINDYRTTGNRNLFIKIKVFITLLLAVPYVLCQYACYFVIEADLQKATILNLHSLPTLHICWKILVFWLCMDSQCRLFSLVRKDFVNVPKEKKDATREIYKKITRKANLFCLTVFVLDSSVILVNILFPGVSVDYILYYTGNVFDVTTGRKKILAGWYPLPISESPCYEIVLLYEAVLVAWGGMILAVYDSLVCQVLLSLHAQYKVLGYHVSTLKIDSRRRKDDSHMYRELKIILQDHQRLLCYANEMKSVYNPLVTIGLGIGIGVLIIAAFQYLFGKTGDPMFIFKSLQFLASQGLEVSIFCFGSSYLETASSDLHFAIYNSDWYKADTKFRKAAQMMMIRSKRGVTLTALRIYPISVETLMSIFQFTYTTSALMSRMID